MVGRWVTNRQVVQPQLRFVRQLNVSRGNSSSFNRSTCPAETSNTGAIGEMLLLVSQSNVYGKPALRFWKRLLGLNPLAWGSRYGVHCRIVESYTRVYHK